MAPRERYKDYKLNACFIEKRSLRVRSGRFINRLDSLKVTIQSALISNEIDPDYVFISTFDTLTFAIGKLFFKNLDKVFLLHHLNVDELGNRIKRSFFNTYAFSVNHFVFEKFIKDHLVDLCNLKSEKVFILPHQMIQNEQKTNRNDYSCVGLSSSNDESFIAGIVEKEKRSNILKESNCRVILKSAVVKFDNGALKVISGFLAQDIFNDYINNCECVFIPLPQNFRYRVSGTLIDALSNNKIVFGSDVPIVKWYSLLFPNICKIINTVDDFFKAVLSIDSMQKDELNCDFDRLREEHSIEAIENSLKKAFTIPG